ncbi:ATP-binding cassette domain-containing protein [Nitratireductor sp. CAU 1489]|uniref:ATP-binding cassette domain-containing protein n=1 Tax=Nitratireductor arenosus TaxID=2682096 RepID=A0A844QHP7_9HYPH|nr:ABC transporter ATP-binding protein [Nitratireductor arenosus]MVA98992.1 ATP-binding cassette domain-containing protein [Nitratireductor arenosus]
MTAGDAQTPKLRVDAASKVYATASGDLLALDRCSLDVRANEIVSIVGPSGCGKTTLLWSMSGLHGLSGGEILLDGTPIRGPHPDIGLVFQEANLLPWRDLDANIRFPFEIKRIKPDNPWIDHLLQRVGLEGFGGKFPRELSGGMQQRAAMVRALSLRPSVLLMDEPFGALDSFTREEMNRLVEEIWLETQTTIVFITHSIEEAIFLSDRVVVLSGRPGRVAREFSVPFERPRSMEVMATKEVFDLTNAIKMEIVGGRKGAEPQAKRQRERTN